MRAVFAETFYWVALTNPNDSRYQDAVALDGVLAGATILTIDEILTEFLTFFPQTGGSATGPRRRSAVFSPIRKFGLSHRAGNRFLRV